MESVEISADAAEDTHVRVRARISPLTVKLLSIDGLDHLAREYFPLVIDAVVPDFTILLSEAVCSDDCTIDIDIIDSNGNAVSIFTDVQRSILRIK